MRFSAVLVLLTLAPPLFAAPKLDKKACFKLAEDGQDLRTEGKLRDARAKFLECSRDPCPDVVKKDCNKWIGEVEAELPSIVVRATKGGEDVPVVRVTIDGVEVPGYVDGKPVTLDPGTRKLVIEPKGEAAIEQSVIVVAGEKTRVVTVKLPEPKKEPAPLAPTTPTKPAPTVESTRTWPWIFAGVGAVGLVGFGYFSLSGMSDVGKLEDRGCEPRCPDSDVNAIHRKFLIADIALGVSVLSLGIATYGFLSTPAKSDAPTVSLRLGPGFASLQGSF